jgi:hypothetical protein
MCSDYYLLGIQKKLLEVNKFSIFDSYFFYKCNKLTIKFMNFIINLYKSINLTTESD